MPAGEFESVFEREVGPWLIPQPDLPVIASDDHEPSGLGGSALLPLPRRQAGDRTRALRHATGRGRIIHFVPGLSIVGLGRRPT